MDKRATVALLVGIVIGVVVVPRVRAAVGH